MKKFFLLFFFAVFTLLSQEACDKTTPQNPGEIRESTITENSVSSSEISNPLNHLELFINNLPFALSSEDPTEFSSKIELEIKSAHEHLNYTLRYFESTELGKEQPWISLAENIHASVHPLNNIDTHDKYFYFEISVVPHANATFAANSALTRIFILKLLPGSGKKSTHVSSSLEPQITINGDSYDDSDFAQDLTFSKAVTFTISPKKNVRYQVKVKESTDPVFHEVTSPAGDAQLTIYTLGAALPSGPNLVQMEIVAFEADNPRHTVKKLLQFTVDPFTAAPILLFNGNELSKNASFNENSIELSFTRKNEYTYSIYVSAEPNVFHPKEKLHLYSPKFSDDKFTLSLDGNDTVAFKVYIKSVHKPSGARLSRRYLVNLNKQDYELIDIQAMLDGKAVSENSTFEMNLDPAKTAQFSLPPRKSLSYDISATANDIPVNEATLSSVNGVKSYSATLKIINASQSFYKFVIIATTAQGKKRTLTFNVLLKPFTAKSLTNKLDILIDMHQKRVVKEFFLTQVKTAFNAATYSPASKDALENQLKAANTAAQLESGSTQAIDMEQRRALKYYKGSGFIDINKYLRFGTIPLFGNNCSSGLSPEGDIKSCVAQLDAIFNTVTSKNELALPKDIIVYRGGYVDPNFDAQVPYSFSEKAYISSSLNDSTATNFYQGENARFKSQLIDSSPFFVKKSAALLRILIPKGTKVLYLENLCDGKLATEKELLLPRNSTFKVRSDIAQSKEFFDYVPNFNPFARCEICSALSFNDNPYEAYRSVDLELVP